jgi:hypothetical protein
MYLLDSVHQALCWTGISSVDPTLTAEVVLRLAMVYETSAHLETMDGEHNICYCRKLPWRLWKTAMRLSV